MTFETQFVLYGAAVATVLGIITPILRRRRLHFLAFFSGSIALAFWLTSALTLHEMVFPGDSGPWPMVVFVFFFPIFWSLIVLVAIVRGVARRWRGSEVTLEEPS